MKVKANKLLLDNKNKTVLMKVHRNIKLSKIETKRLARTQRIICKTNTKVEQNKINEDKINKLFF